MVKMSLRIEDMEVRTCDDSLMCVTDNPHITAEIIVWEDARKDKSPTCYTIAYFKRIENREETLFDLCFVGTRPFDVNPKIRKEVFWYMVEFGYMYLREQSNKEFSKNND